jgi:HEAT repeat protein
VPPLIEALKDPEWKVREAVAEALGFFSRHGKTVIPALMGSLDDDKAEVRKSAILSLGRLGKGSATVEETLSRYADDPNPAIRLNAGVALAFLGKRDKSSIPILIEAIEGKDQTTAKVAVRLLGLIGAKSPKEALPPLVEILKKRQEPGAGNAIRVLRRMRSHAAPALPHIAALYDEAATVRRLDVLRAVAAIDRKGDRALPTLIKALGDREAKVRKAALLSLLSFRSKSDSFLEPLIAELKDENAENRLMALGIIRGLGTKAAPSIPAVISLTKDPVQKVQTAAISALGSFRPPTPEIVQALEQAIESENSSIRKVSVTALRRIGFVEPEKVIPILEKAREVETDQAVKRSITNSLASLAGRSGQTGTAKGGRIRNDATRIH